MDKIKEERKKERSGRGKKERKTEGDEKQGTKEE
jgi:hypothetical protein